LWRETFFFDSLKISQLKDLSNKEDVPGYGILPDIQGGSFDNPKSSKFFLRMLQGKKVYIQQD